MYSAIQFIDIEPTDHRYKGAVLKKATVSGKCSMASWKMVFHFTDGGEIVETHQIPLFGCKNFDKRLFKKCVPLSNRYQSVPCPILTEQRDAILIKLAVYLLEHSFVNKAVIEKHPNSVFQQALQIVKSQNS